MSFVKNKRHSTKTCTVLENRYFGFGSGIEMTIFIVWKFEYCIVGRPVKLKLISRGISSERYAVLVSYNFIV